MLLAKHGFDEVIANLSYLPERIREHFGDGSALGIELTYSEEPEPLGTAGGVGKVAGLPGRERLLPGHLRRRPHRHRPDRDARGARGQRTTGGSRRSRPSGSRTRRQFGVVITGEDGRIQGFQEKPDPAEALSDLANCGIYMFRAEIFDYFPGRGTAARRGRGPARGFVDWAMDVFPALLEGDVPFHSHEIDGLLERHRLDLASYVQGNADALAGRVSVEASSVAEGSRGRGSSRREGVTGRPSGSARIGAGVRPAGARGDRPWLEVGAGSPRARSGTAARVTLAWRVSEADRRRADRLRHAPSMRAIRNAVAWPRRPARGLRARPCGPAEPCAAVRAGSRRRPDPCDRTRAAPGSTSLVSAARLRGAARDLVPASSSAGGWRSRRWPPQAIARGLPAEALRGCAGARCPPAPLAVALARIRPGRGDRARALRG